jgi:magnesium chelatase family protein
LQVRSYLNRVSGPLLDRIDLHVEVPAVHHEELAGDGSGEASKVVRERVMLARRIQMRRFEGDGSLTNARMPPKFIAGHCQLCGAAEQLLKHAMVKLSLSARAYHRILRVARTIGDLDGCERVESHHVAEAIQYRSLDREV